MKPNIGNKYDFNISMNIIFGVGGKLMFIKLNVFHFLYGAPPLNRSVRNS